MKIGDRVRSPEGLGVYNGRRNGKIGVMLDAQKQQRYYEASTVHLIVDEAKVNAVVGEQCEAILERLRDALGVASIGEVEGAVMMGRPRFEPLTVAAIDVHDGEWLVQTRADGMYLRARIRPGRYAQSELDETFACGMPLDGDGQPTGVKQCAS